MAKPAEVPCFPASWLAITVVVGLGCFACGSEAGSLPYTAELGELFTAIGPARPSPGRVCGRLPYAPRGAVPQPSRGVFPAHRKVLAAAQTERSATTTAAVGLTWLLAGRLDDSVDLLTEAVALNPEDARMHSDLAAILLARGDTEGRSEDYVAAVEHAGRAVALDEGLVEARFNYAVALQRLHLRGTSAAEWRLFTELDRDSPWAEEARQSLADLTRPTPAEGWPSARRRLLLAAETGNRSAAQPIVTRYRDAVRELGEQELLSDWAAQPGTVAGDRALEQAKALGELLAEAGDPLLRAAVDAASSRDENRRQQILAGHLALARGARRYEATDYGAAILDFQSAARALRRGDSPMAMWSAWFEAACEHQRLRLDAAEAILLELINRTLDDSAPSLRARVLWLHALGEMKRGHPDLAASRYRESRELFLELGERENAVAVTALMGEAIDFLGRPEEGWRLRQEALAGSDTLRSPARLHSLLDQAGYAALDQDLPYASMAFRSQLVALAEQWGSPLAKVDAYLRRSRTFLALGGDAEARSDLQQAGSLLPEVADVSMRRRLRADLELALAEQSLLNDPLRSRHLVDRVATFFQESDLSLLLPSLRLIGASASERLGDNDTAASDRLQAIAELEQRVASVGDLGDRARAWNLADRAYRELIHGFTVSRSPAATLDHLEIVKSRAPFGAPSGATRKGGPWTATAVASRLPERVSLVEYAVLDDSLVVGVLRRDEIRMHVLPVGRDTLTVAVKDYTRLVREGHNRNSLRKASRHLWQWLLRSALEAMSEDDALVIVPDGPLYALPFNALVDPDGRYLVERAPSTTVSSGTEFLLALEQERTLSRDDGSAVNALVVGDPAVRTVSRNRFPPLVLAEEETAGVAKLWPNSRVLLGREATVEAFSENAPKARVIHFAGHSQLNRRLPLYSTLILAPNASTGSSGELFAYEIAVLPLWQTDLVVLASCDSARGWLGSLVGPLGLSQAFQMASVPTVIATLWPVTDTDSAALMLDFERGYVAGEPTLEALREAQLRRLADDTAEAALAARWAAYQVLGAGGLSRLSGGNPVPIGTKGASGSNGLDGLSQ